MENIYDLINSQAVATYWSENVRDRVPYLGETLFPAKKKLGLDLSWIKGSDGLPVALKPSHFDTKATFRDRIGVSTVETDMPFFREAMLLKEKDRQELLKLQGNDSAFYADFIGKIYNDRKALIEGALVQSERMRMQLLAYAKITINANGVDLEYNYDADGTFTTNNYTELLTTDKWSDFDNSDPFGDIQEMQNKIESLTGTKPTRLIMSQKVFGYLLKNKTLGKMIQPTFGLERPLLGSAVRAYLLDELGVTILIYEKKFKNEAKATVSFYPEDRVTFLPATTLGSTWYGTTPEEADLMAKTGADVTIVETGIAVATVVKEHPVNIETIVSEIVLPSFENMMEVGILKVV